MRTDDAAVWRICSLCHGQLTSRCTAWLTYRAWLMNGNQELTVTLLILNAIKMIHAQDTFQMKSVARILPLGLK